MGDAHVALQFMDWRCLRSPHDVEGNGLVGVAAKAFHFEIATLIASPALPPPEPKLRRSSRVTSCPCERGCIPSRFHGQGLPTVSPTLAARVPSKTGLRRGTDIGRQLRKVRKVRITEEALRAVIVGW